MNIAWPRTDRLDSVGTPESEDAPAKINLALHVTGKRSDGYHLIESLVLFTRFGDRVDVEAADEDGFEIRGPFADGLPADDSNLVIRARDALRQTAALPPVRITLSKNLPIASGIGGGSSDAAAVLKALNRFWQLGMDPGQLAGIGVKLGADVPMCLSARPLVARGIGAELERLSAVPAVPLVLVNPGRPVSTAAVFAALENRENAPLPPLPSSFDFHGLRNWLELTRNDLEAAARKLEPSISETIRALDRAGSGFSRMSGSGATCFGLFETNNVAKRAALAIRERHPGWFVASTRAIASEDSA